MCWAVAAGALLGLAQHTYTVARFLPLYVLIVLIGVIVLRVTSRQDAIAGLVVTGLTSALLFAPLGFYFLANSSAFGGRAGPSGSRAIFGRSWKTHSIRSACSRFEAIHFSDITWLTVQFSTP